MNAHPKFSIGNPRFSASDRKVSQAELARFLGRFAEMYRDPRTGNPRLAAALSELAQQLGQSARALKRSAQPKHEQPAIKQEAFQWLRGLDTEAVRRFISDATKSKSQLIELASERFSIPRSRLVRTSIQGVREEILAAIMHEESIRIISQEAERAGNNRSS
jgi:hypothetical protein